MSAKRILSIVLVASVVMLAVGISPRFTGIARALPPVQQPAGATIPYPGRLTDGSGQPVADGVYAFTFALYAVSTGGEPLWTEAQEGVVVQGGAFTALLGNATPLPKQILDGGVHWLQVAVRGPGESGFTPLSPRQELSAAASTAPASPSAGPACAHDHLGEEWTGTFTGYGLKINNLGSGVAVRGDSQSGAGAGVYGKSSSNTGTGVYGVNDQNGFGVQGISNGTGWGVFGSSTSGTGVYGFGGAYAGYFSGRMFVAADTVLYLSPHDMAVREEATSVISLTLQDNGGVRVRNMAGGLVTRYLVIPVSTFGTLFGSPLYVKSLEVCYKSPAAWTYIQTTGVYKNPDSDGGWSTYIQDTTPLSSTVYACHQAIATTPRQAIDNSTWVQFNMSFGGSGSGADIYIYTVKLTLSESQN
jgi:hypothetical protein